MNFDQILDKLSFRRKLRSLDFRQLGKITGYSYSTHHKWEKYRDRPRSVTLHALIDWAKALGFKVELVDDEDGEERRD